VFLTCIDYIDWLSVCRLPSAGCLFIVHGGESVLTYEPCLETSLFFSGFLLNAIFSSYFLFIIYFIYTFLPQPNSKQPQKNWVGIIIGRNHHHHRRRHRRGLYKKHIKTALLEHKTTQVRLRYYNRKKNHRRGLYKKNHQNSPDRAQNNSIKVDVL
jgi:hypothetical protein